MAGLTPVLSRGHKLYNNNTLCPSHLNTEKVNALVYPASMLAHNQFACLTIAACKIYICIYAYAGIIKQGLVSMHWHQVDASYSLYCHARTRPTPKVAHLLLELCTALTTTLIYLAQFKKERH